MAAPPAATRAAAARSDAGTRRGPREADRRSRAPRASLRVLSAPRLPRHRPRSSGPAATRRRTGRRRARPVPAGRVRRRAARTARLPPPSSRHSGAPLRVAAGSRARTRAPRPPLLPSNRRRAAAVIISRVLIFNVLRIVISFSPVRPSTVFLSRGISVQPVVASAGSSNWRMSGERSKRSRSSTATVRSSSANNPVR